MSLFHVKTVLVLLLIKYSNTQWLNCSQVDFCERLRNQPRNNSYILHSLTSTPNSVTALVNNTDDDDGQSNTTYNFTLHFISDGIFRVTIDDANNPRHRVQDVLDGEPEKIDFNVTSSTDAYYNITSANAEVVVHKNPLLIAFYWKNELVAIVDTKRLVFEDEPYGAIGLEFLFYGAQRAYGLPEHADHFVLRETVNSTNPYRLYNIDNYGYATESTQALYGSVPVLYAQSEITNQTVGVFWHNSAQTFVDIGREFSYLFYTYFMSESGVIDFFILAGPTFKNAVQQYAKLTGNVYLHSNITSDLQLFTQTLFEKNQSFFINTFYIGDFND